MEMQIKKLFQFTNKCLYNLLFINTYFVFINIIYILFYKQNNMQKIFKRFAMQCNAKNKK